MLCSKYIVQSTKGLLYVSSQKPTGGPRVYTTRSATSVEVESAKAPSSCLAPSPAELSCILSWAD